jgi:hypothetical protein
MLDVSFRVAPSHVLRPGLGAPAAPARSSARPSSAAIPCSAAIGSLSPVPGVWLQFRFSGAFLRRLLTHVCPPPPPWSRICVMSSSSVFGVPLQACGVGLGGPVQPWISWRCGPALGTWGAGRFASPPRPAINVAPYPKKLVFAADSTENLAKWGETPGMEERCVNTVGGRFSHRLNPEAVKNGWQNRLAAILAPEANLETDGTGFSLAFSPHWGHVGGLKHAFELEVHRIDMDCEITWFDAPLTLPHFRNLGAR